MTEKLPLKSLPNLFVHEDYKSYILAALPLKGRGARSAMAAEIGCQLAYVSQVLKGDAHFNLEQAEGVSRYFAHTSEETHYFLLLVQRARAGTRTLESYFHRQIIEFLERRMNLKERLDVRKSLSPDDQATYYSAWYYAAAHILLGIPEFQTIEAITKKLELDAERVISILEFLERRGLAVLENGRWRRGDARMHLGSDSPMISKHHSNWHYQAVRSLERGRKKNAITEDLHYSSVITISEQDVVRLKSLLIGELEKMKAIIKDSADERLYCLSLGLFEV